MLRYAHEIELIESVPQIRLLRLPPQELDFLTFEELSRLLEAVKDDPERAGTAAPEQRRGPTHVDAASPYGRTHRTFGPRSEAGDRTTRAAFTAGGVRQGPLALADGDGRLARCGATSVVSSHGRDARRRAPAARASSGVALVAVGVRTCS
jgi:hypothetical protein